MDMQKEHLLLIMYGSGQEEDHTLTIICTVWSVLQIWFHWIEEVVAQLQAVLVQFYSVLENHGNVSWSLIQSETKRYSAEFHPLTSNLNFIRSSHCLFNMTAESLFKMQPMEIFSMLTPAALSSKISQKSLD